MNSSYTPTIKLPLKGFELALQHNFSETGFGLAAHYNSIETSSEYKCTYDLFKPIKPTLCNVNDSANAILFFDKNQWYADINLNWQQDYLQLTSDTTGRPTVNKVGSILQVNFSLNYQLQNNLNISAAITNVLGETFYLQSAVDRTFLAQEDLGKQYQLGISYQL